MYGFRMFGYLLGVALIGLVVGLIVGFGVGSALGLGREPGLVLGLTFAFVMVYAGSVGLIYKVIADGVYAGVNASDAVVSTQN